MKNAVKILILCLILLPSYGCGSRNQIIPEEKMARVIADLELLEGIMTTLGGVHLFTDYQRRTYHESILNKHNITQEIFDKSLMWYARNPELLEQIYAKAHLILQEKGNAIVDEVVEVEENYY